MAEVKVDLTGQVAQFDATISFTGDEVLDAFKAEQPIEKVVPVAQFVKYGLKLTAQLVPLPAVAVEQPAQ